MIKTAQNNFGNPRGQSGRVLFLIIVLINLIDFHSAVAQTFNPSFSGRISGGDGPPPYLSGATDVAVSGNFAYVGGNGLEVVDVSLPGAPVHRGSLRSVDDPAVSAISRLFVSGSYVYAMSGDNFLIIDVSNPAAPKRVGVYSFPVNFSIYGVALHVSGNYAYISATVSAGLKILDISNPTNPQLKFNNAASNYLYPTITAWPAPNQKIYVSGIYCYLITNNTLEIWDVSNPVSPIRTNQPSLTDAANLGNANDIAVATYSIGATLYTFAFVAQATPTHAVSVFNVTNPANPVYLNKIADGMGGAELSNPWAIDILTDVSGNRYACVTSQSGDALEVLNIQNVVSSPPTHVSVIYNSSEIMLENPRRIFISGTTGFVASAGSSSLEILNLTNPSFPSHVGSISKSDNQILLGGSLTCAASGSYVFVGNNTNNSIAVVDNSEPQNPTFVTNILNGDFGALISNPSSMAINGNFLYVANKTISGTQATVQVFDITNPKVPVAAGSYSSNASGRSIAISGSYAYVLVANPVGNNYAMLVIDVSNPKSSLSVSATVQTNISSSIYPAAYQGVYDVYHTISILGNKAYIIANGNLVTIDIVNPLAPSTPSYLPITYASSGVVRNIANKPYAFVASTIGPFTNGSNDFFRIYDLTTSTQVASFNTPFMNTHIAVITKNNSTYAMLAKFGSSAIDIFDVSNPSSPTKVKTLSSFTVNNPASNLNLNRPYYVTTSGNLAFVTTGTSHLEILDLFGSEITVFSPTTGNENSTVTITGQNFDSYLTVAFNGLPGTVTSYSPTQAIVTVPVGAKIGKITIASRGTSVSTANFLVIPKALSANGISQNGFTANWSDVGATKYFLDISTSNSFTSFITGYQNRDVGNVNSFNVSGLSAGTNYFWRVRSTDGISFNTINTGAVSSFTASWTNVGSSGYFLDVSTQSNFSTFVTGYNNRNVGAVSSFTVSGLSAGTTYYWRVRASDGTNITSVSGNSNPVNTITIPSTPTATAASAFTQSGFNVNWNAVGGIVTNYFLDVATDNGFTNFVPGYNNLSLAGTTQVVSGLNPGTYYARVRSANASGSSPNSNTLTIATIPPNPVASPASSIGTASFNANWSSVAGVTNYFLDVSSDNFATFVINNLNVAGNSTTASITGLSSGVTYQYRVRASNASGTSGNSNIVSTITIPSAPSVQSASSITTSSFTVNWTLAVGATSYTVEWATNDLFTSGYSSSPALGNVSSYNITGLTNGTAYFYRVTATNTNGSSSPSNPTRTQRTLSLQPITQSTSILFTTISNTQLTVNCTAPANGGGNARLIVVSANAPLNTLPVNQTSYSANPIFGSANTALGNGFVVSNSSNTQVTVTNLQPGTTYFFQVFDFNGSNGTENYLTSAATGNPASQVTLSTPPGNQPTNLTFSNITSSSLSASYTAPLVSPAGYLALRSSTSGIPAPPSSGVVYSAGSTIGNNTVVYVGSATSFSESGLAAGNTYYYTIYSYNGTGSTLNYLVITPLQNAVTLTPPAPVAGTATSVTDSGFTANWASANGATNYFLDVSSDNFITFLPGYNSRSVTGTSASVSNLSSGTSYQYRVRANISTGSLVSAYSNTTFLITRPAAPVAQAASSITNSSFTANWALTTGASSYLLEWATNTAFTSGYGSYSTPSGNISSYNITGLPTATPYFYRITSSNQSGISNFSSVISLKTLADPANVQSGNLTFSNISSSSITINFAVGNGSSRIVVASAGSPLLTALPSNQTSYTANSAFGSGSAIGNGFVVSNGNVSSVTVTNLALASIYFFQVFEYTGTNGTENYLTTSAANNPASQATLASTSALTQPTNLIFSNITGTTLTGSFTTASGNPSGYLVIRSTAASIPTAPVNGTNYTTGSNYGSDRVAYAGPSASFSDSGLGNGITYYYTIYSFSGSGSTTNYLTSNPLQNSVTTIPPAPVIANASAIGSNGFTANWSATTGAVDYLLDISTDNFTTLVPGYSSLLVGSVTSYQAAGLIAGTSYRYRVRARNNSGISVSSNSTAVTTLPSPPTGLSISNVADNSFSLTWSKSLGATGYFIDVSPNSSFTTLTYNNINAGDVSSFSIGGLAAGSTYYVRVRSSNTTGPSSNSSSVSATTYAVFPSQQSGSISFSNVNSTSITANFTVGNGSSRLMVVSFGAPLTATPVNGFSYSADTKFGSGTPIGNGFVVSTGAGLVTVTNLQPTSLYYFQVFEFNGSGGTENYNKQTVTGNPLSQSTISFTPLEQPTNLLFSGQTSSSVNVSFTPAVNNPSGYLVLRTTNAAPSVAPVNGTAYTIGTSLGNSVVASVGPSVSFFDGGLPMEKTYTYTVYAYNGVGSTSSYLVVNPLQANVILDTTPPVISFPISNPTSITEGNTPLFNATVIDNVSVKSVTFFYRGISQVNFKSVAMNSGTSNNYSVQIQSDWYDSLGLEYYVQAIDQNNNTSARGTSFFARLIKPSITLPSLPTGTGLADYRIVSFPYLLPVNNDVTTVYSNVPWNDNAKAGLWWWNPSANNGLGGYDQYGKSPTLKTIDPGKGYWVITSSPVTPQLTNVPAPNYNKDKLYQMNLKPGWNQIGNPYPISVSWDEVIAYNEARGSAAFGKLNIYDGQTIKEATGNTLLKAFQGGFVKNLTSSDITLQIPMPGQAKGGRKATAENSDITQDAWRLFLHIQQGGIKNELGGFGMHPKATMGEDPFDNFNIPAFVNAPEVQFSRTETPKSIFSSDVVKTQAHFVWTFKPKGVGAHKARLSWNEQIIAGDQQLFLLDEENLNIVDMSQVSYYDFNLSATSSFKIYYGKDAIHSITSEKIQISEPHPNPVSTDNLVTFKMALPQTVDPYSVQIQVFNLQGITIYKSEKKFAEGLRQLELELHSDLPAGTYLYQVVVSSPNLQESRTGKLIKK